MNESVENKEPEKNWRIKYKKINGGIQWYEDNYKDHLPLDLSEYKERFDDYVSLGQIPREEADCFYKRSVKRWGDIGEIPKHESKRIYPYLKSWFNRIEATIPVLNLNDEKYADKYYAIKHTPYIITKCGSLFNAKPGWAYRNEEIPYIALSPEIHLVARRLGAICSPLFYVIQNQDDEKFLDPQYMKELMLLNIKRFPDIVKYLKGLCYHVMFRDVIKPEDENKPEYKNLIKWLNEKDETYLLTTQTQLPTARADLLIGDPITEAIGLFLMGHEYSHIILGHLSSSISDNFLENYEKEYAADKLGFKLAYKHFREEFKENDNFDGGTFGYYFFGLVILFNFLHIIDRLTSSLVGSQKVIMSDTHPKTKERMQRLREIILHEAPFHQVRITIDALDYIFQKLEEHIVDEFTKDGHIQNYVKSVRSEIGQEIDEMRKIQETVKDDEKTKEQCEIILNRDPNNIEALYRLGMIYLFNKQDNEARNYFRKIVVITMPEKKGEPFDPGAGFGFYGLGLLDFKIVSEMAMNDENKEQITALWDDVIKSFEIAAEAHHFDGLVFFYLGLAFSADTYDKKDYESAKFNFNQALDRLPVLPENTKVISKRGILIQKLAESQNLSPLKYCIKLAKKGNPIDQFMLGYYYEHGLCGPVDLKEALRWYTKSAKKWFWMGFHMAQYKLGEFYENGHVKRKNMKKAIKWYKKAAVWKYTPAIKKLEKLSKI